jgi:High-affinity nickel-transport protein
VLGLLLGLLVGLRHAFEPDHLAAVGTFVAEHRDGRRGALLGALWGLGHTVSLVVVGIVLAVLGASLPANVAAGFELAVAVMLVGLGIRAIARAIRSDGDGPVTTHRHGIVEHAHADASSHVHVGRRVVLWRPLAIGLVHGLAGSGALTALVFAELSSNASRLGYITLFGIGSIAGMAIATAVAGVSLQALARNARARRRFAIVTGAISITIGIVWGIPMANVLLA